MPAFALPSVAKRADDGGIVYYVDGDGRGWYLSSKAAAIKYGILFGILGLAFVVIFGSWFHARSRLKKGLPPLGYHRWLVPRSQRQPNHPENNFSFYNQNPDGYDMHAVPPPVYNPNFQQPPAYPGNPPPGFVKQDPFQDPPQTQTGANGEGSSHPVPMPTPTPAHTAPPPRYA